MTLGDYLLGRRSTAAGAAGVSLSDDVHRKVTSAEHHLLPYEHQM